MRTPSIARFLLLLLCPEFFVLPCKASPYPAFILERTTNANRVVYEVDPAKHEPVHPYWKMLQADGHTEELTAYERKKIYGVTFLAKSENGSRFSIQALPAYPLTIQDQDGSVTIRVRGENWRLKKIFLKLAGSLFPELRSVELTCTSTLDESERHFSLTPAEGGNWKETETEVPL